MANGKIYLVFARIPPEEVPSVRAGFDYTAHHAQIYYEFADEEDQSQHRVIEARPENHSPKEARTAVRWANTLPNGPTPWGEDGDARP